ncbi:uncharacterized protein [Nicotiana sylvestris]|uniref:uncharacterized protein n=1 Tax=Nicotiana sylvestris TaxID=4096 RepID=UPI00388CBC27
MLTTEYELFRMKDDESIQDMHTRFTFIINKLHSPGETIPRNKVVRKILSILPSLWESKVNAIVESKDLQELTIEELVGNLKTYEMKRKIDSERREPKKEKNLVLKADSNDSSEEDSDMAYLTKRFRKMARRNGEMLKRGSSSKSKNYDLYHKCRKTGHFIKDCPLLKQKLSKYNSEKAAKRNPVPLKDFKRKRSVDNMVKQALAAWGDFSSKSEDETDVGDSSIMEVESEEKEYDLTFALMAQSDDDEDNDNKEVTFRYVQKNLKSYTPKKLMSLANVLIDTYHNLVEDKDDLILEQREVDKTIDDLREKVVLTKTIANLEHERNDLVVVVLDHKETIENFSEEKEALARRVTEIEEERDDLFVEIVDLMEIIKGLRTKSKPGNTGKGKEIASEEHIRPKNELKAMRTRMCFETNKNKHLQTELKRVKNDLEKSLKWTWSSKAITAMNTNNGGNMQGIGFQREKTPYNLLSKCVTVLENWLSTHYGNNGHFMENCQTRVQFTQKNRMGTVKGSGPQWFMDSGYSKHMARNTMDFLSLKSLQGGSVSFGNGKNGYILGICNKGNKVEFLSKICTVTDLVTGEVKIGEPKLLSSEQTNLEGLGPLSAHVKSKRDVISSKPLELLHMDFYGPMREQSRGGKRYIFVIVDDYSRFTWTLFLRTKDETFESVEEDQDGEPLLVPGEVIDMTNGKADMMSQVKELSEDNTSSSSIEPGTSITTTEAEERVVDAVQGIPLAPERRTSKNQSNVPTFSTNEPQTSNWRHKSSHPLDNIITPLDSRFERNNVWHLVPRPSDRTIIGTRWVFRNKLDEHGNTTRNKARLVVQGYNEEEGIDYDETFAPVACMEAIRILIAFASHMEFTLFQMDVKNAFLNGFLKEKVYVKQPPGFECQEHPDYVFKLDKALSGLKQAPRAWYERLSKFLLKIGFKRGKIDNTLFLKKQGRNFLIVHVYVDDIIFGATTEALCEEFAKLMGKLLKRFDMEASKVIDTHIATATLLDMDETGSPVNQTMYRGIIGYLLYLTASRPDIIFSVGLCPRFQSNPKESYLKAAKRILRYLKGTQDLGTRKQNSVALLTTEAEYVAVASCCAQLLWIKQQLEDFGVLTESVPLLYDNTSALNMAKNPVQHKRTKYIDVRHHFLRDNVEKGLIYMKFCSTEDQIADIFTKH